MSRNVPSEKESLLALALASGASVGAAAAQADADRKTVQRKLADPAFCRQVATFRGELIATALGRMADNMTPAADKLAAMLDEENLSIRRRAIRALISLGMRLHDAVNVGQRIRDLQDELARRI